MTCLCSHPKEQHGQRMAREGKPRTLASACLTPDCRCENFTAETGAGRDKIDPEISAVRNELRMMQRRHKEEFQKLRDRIDELTARHASHV